MRKFLFLSVLFLFQNFVTAQPIGGKSISINKIGYKYSFSFGSSANEIRLIKQLNDGAIAAISAYNIHTKESYIAIWDRESRENFKLRQTLVNKNFPVMDLQEISGGRLVATGGGKSSIWLKQNGAYKLEVVLEKASSFVGELVGSKILLWMPAYLSENVVAMTYLNGQFVPAANFPKEIIENNFSKKIVLATNGDLVVGQYSNITVWNNNEGPYRPIQVLPSNNGYKLEYLLKMPNGFISYYTKYTSFRLEIWELGEDGNYKKAFSKTGDSIYSHVRNILVLANGDV